MKVAAYQAPLRDTSSMEILNLIREQLDWRESNGVEILCCPEAVLGGLADYASRLTGAAIEVEAGELLALLTPLASGLFDPLHAGFQGFFFTILLFSVRFLVTMLDRE